MCVACAWHVHGVEAAVHHHLLGVRHNVLHRSGVVAGDGAVQRDVLKVGEVRLLPEDVAPWQLLLQRVLGVGVEHLLLDRRRVGHKGDEGPVLALPASQQAEE